MTKARPVTDSPNRYEALIGRSLAMCAHPAAAWRVGSTRARLVVVAGYFVAGYVVSLGALLAGI